jgi:hypothetical protein
MTQLQSIIGDYSVFLKDIISQVENAGFDTADFTQRGSNTRLEC